MSHVDEGDSARAPGRQWCSGPMGLKTRTRQSEAMAYDTTLTPVPPAARILLTKAGRRTLLADLDDLRAAKRRDIRRRLREARGYGDAGANDEYLATREDEAIIDARIAALETTLAQASVAEEDARPGVVGIGSIVTVDDVDTGAGARYRLVGSHEARAPGDVSIGSPVGQALLGRGSGDTVAVALPDGRTRELGIASVGQPNR
jgi:transcription elongation factor GreA